jgi:hypothetical protein
MGRLLVCNWLHFVGQNHFFVMMLLNRDSAIQSDSRRFYTVYKSEKLDPLQPSGRRDIPSGRAKPKYGNYVQLKCDCPDGRAPPSGRGSNQERILAKFWKADRTVVHSDALCLQSGQRLGLSSQTLI